MQLNLLSGQSEPLHLAFYADPGHGWLQVDMRHLAHLGLRWQISAYSYISRDGKFAYLEEDCDASRYMEACRAAGVNVTLREHHSNSDSWIRQLPRFPATREDNEGQLL